MPRMQKVEDNVHIIASPHRLTHLHSPLGGLVGLHDVGMPQVHAVHGLQGAPHCGRGRGRRQAAAGHELGSAAASAWLATRELSLAMWMICKAVPISVLACGRCMTRIM